MDLTRLSRRLSGLTGGPASEMLCARLHRSGPRWLVMLIDAAFFVLRGEVGHCAACYRWEHRPIRTIVDRLRAEGL